MKTNFPWPGLFSPVMGMILLGGCGSLPPPPEGDLCTIDYPRRQGSCFPITEIKDRKDLELEGVVRLANGGYRIPLEDMDRYVAQSPQTWNNLQDYIDALTEKAKKCAKSFAEPSATALSESPASSPDSPVATPAPRP